MERVDFYLVQHGEATSEQEDPARPLTPRGRSEVERVARRAATLGLDVAEVVHSGKLRARETAEILAQHVKPARGVREMAGLAPLDDPSAARDALAAATGPVMVVGHVPHLARLAALLLVGDPGPEIVAFRMGAIVCFDRAPAGARLRWILTPELAQ